MPLTVDIEKTLGEFKLKVNFTAENGVLALLGASGCGKSMTLKCIAGIEKPDKGTIILDDVVLFDSEKKINLPPQKRRVGYLFQNYALFPHMTVRKNIETGLRRADNGTVDRLIQMMKLEGLENHYPNQLSGGQQQRCALARLLINEPKILLLDEPFSALDHHLRFKLEEEMRQIIRDFGGTVLLVSHDRDEVYRMSDRIAVMSDGSLEAIGEKKAVFAAPVTKTGAMLTGCKNISKIRVVDNCHIYAEDWGITLETAEDPQGYAYAGIRMHSISLTGDKNRIEFELVEEVENPFSVTAMLRAKGRVDGALIGWEMEKATWAACKKESMTLFLPPEKILLLRK